MNMKRTFAWIEIQYYEWLEIITRPSRYGIHAKLPGALQQLHLDLWVGRAARCPEARLGRPSEAWTIAYDLADHSRSDIAQDGFDALRSGYFV